jgi:trimethylamine:corrinoid methyltransferase-like protein
VSRAGYDAWVRLGKPDMYSKVREIVEEILASAPQHPLSDDQAGKLDEVISRIDRRGAAEKP